MCTSLCKPTKFTSVCKPPQYMYELRADQIESSQDEDSTADESGKRGKGPRKQAAKYDSFEPEEGRYLVNNFYVIDTLWLTNILLFFSAPKIDKLKIWRQKYFVSPVRPGPYVFRPLCKFGECLKNLKNTHYSLVKVSFYFTCVKNSTRKQDLYETFTL